MIFKTQFTVPVEIQGDEFKATFRLPKQRDELKHEAEIKGLDKDSAAQKLSEYALSHLVSIEGLEDENGAAITPEMVRGGETFFEIVAALMTAFWVGRVEMRRAKKKSAEGTSN